MKRSKLKLIFVLSILLLLFLTSLNVFTSYIKIEKTVEESIANQSIQSAMSIASSIDTEQYKSFLANPVKSEDYWEIRNYLNDAREKIGALYVYTLKVDNPKVSRGMIIGMPEDDEMDYPIGEICTVPEEQVRKAYEGQTYKTGVLNDTFLKTSYISVGAPIIDNEGTIIGYIGIDIGTDMVNEVGSKILKDSVSMFVFNILFVFLVLISFIIIQRWYVKERKRELEDTEDTYQTEFKSLISSVQSLRHDFTNHLQVIHGLLKLGEQGKALEYSSSLVNEVRTVSDVKLRIDNPGLSVLLQTKKLAALNHSIDLSFDVSNGSFNKLKTIDLIKILSNLIDNAIEAAIELPEGQRKMSIVIKEDIDHYLFEISNTGTKIEDTDTVFKRGFTTKKTEMGKIRGQGLFIVKDVTKKYGGKITIRSTKKETTVLVVIPL
ncbi:sensor histidine kinase [Litchfieldia salsa]|uniref:Sensor_kinase_SpoOB-type, alpha-helical domain n=1 Tax=Litchfieldia salsa TaxID=930152 RepID=A0A1H0W006_9BACI|nr:GHKL domain-containing protein [Litchfieldia salsa]SDP83716.1 Sensor_kinase_SpoOB-type, alpha-helical domain [Litchfieldia salsa]